jgi:hypothetical protein
MLLMLPGPVTHPDQGVKLTGIRVACPLVVVHPRKPMGRVVEGSLLGAAGDEDDRVET